VSKISDLAFRYLHRALVASKGTPTQYTADSGSTTTAACSALSEADDYWNGAVVRWDSGSNAGLYSCVKDFTASSDTLEFGTPLPYSVANGDTFTLIHGGKYVSDQRIPGMELSESVNVAGFALTYASHLNGEGTGTLSFAYNGGVAQGLTWTPPGDVEGTEVDISGLSNGEAVALHGGGVTVKGGSKYIIVTRTADALPTADAEDAVYLATPQGSHIPFVIGADASAGVTLYRAMGIENTGDDALYNLRAYCPQPFQGAENTTVASGGDIGTGADELTAESLAEWGAHGFVYNATKDDLRYYYDRSGDVIQIADPDGGIRGFAAQAWDEDDMLEPYPWIDIGVEEPDAGNEFADPATRATAPSGVTFTCPRTAATGLAIGQTKFIANQLAVVWERLVIPLGCRPLEAGRAHVHINAQVTETA
jgi:YD repeat-containing protein